MRLTGAGPRGEPEHVIERTAIAAFRGVDVIGPSQRGERRGTVLGAPRRTQLPTDARRLPVGIPHSMRSAPRDLEPLADRQVTLDT
jgi:hypothetical protein